MTWRACASSPPCAATACPASRTPAARHAAQQRAERVAAGLGFGSITGYLAARRGAGWTWQAIAAESGQPPTWLRRRAAPAERR